MRKKISKILLTGTLLGMASMQSSAQIYSFEDKRIPAGWSFNGGELEVSGLRHKLGDQSLRISWQGKGLLTLDQPFGIKEASKASSGGITTWIYNETPIDAPMIFSFLDEKGEEVCKLSFNLNFKGWRCLWSKFVEDLQKPRQAEIKKVTVALPEAVQQNNIYFDYFEFSKNVSWQKMSDLQYTVNHKDFSLIHDFIGYRNMQPDLSGVMITADKKAGINRVNERLTDWYLGSEENSDNGYYRERKKAEQEYIGKGIKSAASVKVDYHADGTPVGKGLFPLFYRSVIDGTKISSFMDINKSMLLPLAFDYKKNGNKESLDKALFIYDWFNDQGWADGSGMGTLCFEKLRSSGYFHSFYLLKDQLDKQKYEREVKNLKWMTLFGHCYEEPHHGGEVADNLRALALPKLIYALSLEGDEQYAAMDAYKAYMDNALKFGPGFFGTIKPDFSGYHHRGAYNSAYYPHALYAASLIAYLLHETPYALSEESMSNLKQALLTFRFFSANLSVPAATTGRFPLMQDVLQHLVPAFAYVALSMPETDTELIGAMKKICQDNPDELKKFWKDVNSNLTYTASMGEVGCVFKALNAEVNSEENPQGSLFMPYSGLMVIKNGDYHFNMKGFSRYIWDYECSTTENLYGRYISYGQIEHFNLKTGKKSYQAANKNFDWNHLPGTTSKVMAKDQLRMKDGMKTHRSFSDETFLAGVAVSEKTGMFSLKMHDVIYDNTFRANKSVIAFDDILLCIGSGINNSDKENPTVTTLFQNAEKKKVRKDKNGTIVSLSDNMVYAVRDNDVHLSGNDDFSAGYINHGTAPKEQGYAYFILPDGTKKQAKQLLGAQSPVSILRNDDKVHLVEHRKNQTVYGAVFDINESFPDQVVRNVNIPLAYVLEKGNDKLRLSVCEPDMRRPSALVMDKLTSEDVIGVEQGFQTCITLNGTYELKNDNGTFGVKHQNGITTLTFETIRGENYQVELIKK
ncbi:MAG: chondroitinase family polysaccharide lyase [Bacteroidales bacterium]